MKQQDGANLQYRLPPRALDSIEQILQTIRVYVRKAGSFLLKSLYWPFHLAQGVNPGAVWVYLDCTGSALACGQWDEADLNAWCYWSLQLKSGTSFLRTFLIE